MTWARFLPFAIAIGAYMCGVISVQHYWYGVFGLFVVGWFVGDLHRLIAKAESRNV